MNELQTALIVGAGDGLSASLARLLRRRGCGSGSAARNVDKLRELADGDRGRHRRPATPAEPEQVGRCSPPWTSGSAGRPTSWSTMPAAGRADRWSSWTRRPWQQALQVACVRRLPGGAAGGAADAAARQGRDPVHRRLGQRQGLQALRPVRDGASSRCAGLAQSIARELAPQGIHVAPFRDRRRDPQSWAAAEPSTPDRCSTPTRSRAPTSHVLRQDRSAWTWEVELRPWVENF